MALRAFLIATLLASCTRGGNETPAPNSVAVPAPASPPPAAAGPSSARPAGAPGVAYPAPLPVGGTPSPARIVLKNTSADTLELGDREQPMEGLHLVNADGALGELLLDGKKAQCECACSDVPCPLCEARQRRPFSIAAGAAHELSWNGIARRYRRGERQRCYETFVPPPGKYRLAACAGADCDAIELTLPATKTIVIALTGTQQRAESCPRDPGLTERAARIALTNMGGELPALGSPLVAKLSACDPRKVRCVPRAELAPPSDGSDCTLAIAPGPIDYELRAWLGVESVSVFVDPGAMFVRAVRYR